MWWPPRLVVELTRRQQSHPSDPTQAEKVLLAGKTDNGEQACSQANREETSKQQSK